MQRAMFVSEHLGTMIRKSDNYLDQIYRPVIRDLKDDKMDRCDGTMRQTTLRQRIMFAERYMKEEKEMVERIL